jgi:hypothetical protein
MLCCAGIHPVRLNLSVRISQPFNNVFLSQQISISISRSAVFLQPAEQGDCILEDIFLDNF